MSQKITIFALMSILMVTSIPVSFGATAGEEWNAIKSELSAAEKATNLKDAMGHLQSAKTIYQNVFENAALAVDPESDALIDNAFAHTAEMLEAGNVEQAALNRQIIDKTIYKIAFMKMEEATENDDASDFLYWYDVLEKKFKISSGDYESKVLISQIKEDPSTLSENGPVITNEILQIFKLKTFEEIEEAIAALESDDLKGAKKFAYEGLYYYRTFHPAVEEKLGTEDANHLMHEMEEVIEVTVSGKPIPEIIEELKHISAEVELLIRQYEGGDTSETGLALSGIKDRLNLVNIEYVDAVKDGKIINQGEYDETVVFLGKAIELFNDNKVTFMELSSSDTTALETNFEKLNNIVTNLGDPSEVSILVGKSLNNVISLQEYAGGAVEIDALQYVDEIERLLKQAKQEYRNGNTQTAFNLVSEAYLDNYEFIEGPLGEIDHELMFKIETDMREDLRNMIQSNAPVSEVDAQIDMILTDMSQVRKVIPEFGTIAALILAVAIISIVAVSAKSRLSIIPRY
ncbi:MAG: PEFG-CTERM sorting domain-containing protein [Nitrosopumilaceae archaeon]|nr:PEFG-CTERM sorting domain-containing protein [Nitrosopumilaceae archaeon]